MTWKCKEQPTYFWDKDVWERGKDGKLFIAFVEHGYWLSKDEEKIPFDKDIIIGECC